MERRQLRSLHIRLAPFGNARISEQLRELQDKDGVTEYGNSQPFQEWSKWNVILDQPISERKRRETYTAGKGFMGEMIRTNGRIMDEALMLFITLRRTHLAAVKRDCAPKCVRMIQDLGRYNEADVLLILDGVSSYVGIGVTIRFCNAIVYGRKVGDERLIEVVLIKEKLKVVRRPSKSLCLIIGAKRGEFVGSAERVMLKVSLERCNSLWEKVFASSLLDDGRGSGSWMFLFVWQRFMLAIGTFVAGKVALPLESLVSHTSRASRVFESGSQSTLVARKRCSSSENGFRFRLESCLPTSMNGILVEKSQVLLEGFPGSHIDHTSIMNNNIQEYKEQKRLG
ncbi:hypothetical protein Tco_0315541 [Tanacetum coccineum]